MTTLLLVLTLARAAYGHAPLVRCERALGEEFVEMVVRMKTLRTLPTHDKAGSPTPELRAVLDDHLENLFPDDVRALNATPLPVLHVKAEEKLPGESSSHTLMILKIPGGSPAALVHRETHGDQVTFLTTPLGEPAIRELRESLLEAYQLRDPLSPRPDHLRLMALFAADRLRVDPSKSNGLSYTDYVDVLQIEPAHPGPADEWALTLRQDSSGTMLVRRIEDGEVHLDVFEAEYRGAAYGEMLERLRAHLLERADTEDLNFFVGEEARPEMWFGKILVERNMIGHALRLPDDDLTHELLGDVYGAHVGGFDRYADESGRYVQIKVDLVRQIKMVTERLRRRLKF